MHITTEAQRQVRALQLPAPGAQSLRGQAPRVPSA